MTDTPQTMADAIDADPADGKPELQLPPSLDELEPLPPANPTGPVSIADIRAMKKAREARHRMTLDTDAARRLEEAQSHLATLYRNLRMATWVRQSVDPDKAEPGKLEELAAEIDQLNADIETATTEVDEAREGDAAASMLWRFRAVGKEPIEELIAKYPATAKQQADYRKQLREVGGDGLGRLQFNAREFHPRLVALCAIEPVLPEADAVDMWQNDPAWSKGELDALFAICWNLNDVAN